MITQRQKIAVGISGGVDSSVAAYLLKREGHEVHGVFVKTWSPEWLPCTWVQEKRDAMRVCAALDIPFHFLDAEEEYKKGVADYMIAEYAAGRTPNPDVLCNRVIKFGALWNYAESIGAEAIATGHYSVSDGMHLKKAVDQSKDQSYFLWMLRSDELSHVAFPIGQLQKSQVRSIAKQAGLFTSEKKDSQGICFLGDVDMREFLSHYIEEKKGEVVDVSGTVIGEHDGAAFYTLGERHGFRITSKDAARVSQYVVGKDIEKNILIVSPTATNNTKHSGNIGVKLRDVNWLATPETGTPYQGQIRYHGALVPVNVIDERTVTLVFDGVVPLGQSLVIYDGDILIGGGVIDEII